jgi:putative endonuclease
MTTSKHRVGKLGEDVAVDYLLGQGYRIITTNWRCQWGEIDIIAHDGREWVFIEVKTRRSIHDNTPFENITSAKMHRLIQSVYTYAHSQQIHSWRIDAIAVILGKSAHIEHIQNAFTD